MLVNGETALAHANKQIDHSYACLLVKRQHWRMHIVGETAVCMFAGEETALAHA
jgi:hypothetical protein